MKATYRVALMLGLAVFSATSVEAAEMDPPTDATIDVIRVVNNYGALVRVYAQDSEGRLHKLGPVARGELKEFTVPEEIVGSFRIKVYPSQAVGSPRAENFAVRTNSLDLSRDTHVTLWLEADLTKSVVELARG